MRLHATAIAIAAALSAPAVAQNLVANPSFETPGPGFDPFASWGVFNNALADDNVEVAAQNGFRTLKTYGGFFGPGIQSDTGAFQRIPVTAGDSYTVSGYAQMLSADPLAPLDFTDVDGNGSFGHLPLLVVDFYSTPGGVTPIAGASFEVQMFQVGTDPADTWVLKSASGVAPANAVEAQVTCLFIQFGDDPGSLFWDSISLEADGGTGGPGCNPADCNADGIINVDDVECFVNNFLAGCP